MLCEGERHAGRMKQIRAKVAISRNQRRQSSGGRSPGSQKLLRRIGDRPCRRRGTRQRGYGYELHARVNQANLLTGLPMTARALLSS